MGIKIEKGVPIPSKKKGGRGNIIYPFSKLDVGDSFLVHFGDVPRPTIRGRVNSARYDFEKRNDREFVARTTPEGIRVWRVK